MDLTDLVAMLPYSRPFLFVDEILEVSESGITGRFTYSENLDFYAGHFKGFPVTPGVILTETMAQVGLVCLGLYLMRDDLQQSAQKSHIMLTSAAVDFLKPVMPGETVTVTSTKEYFRFKKLSCKVVMRNSSNEEVCKGSLAGMMTAKLNG